MLRALDRLSRRQKQAVLLITDFAVFAISLWAAFAVRLGEAMPDHHGTYPWLLLAITAVRLSIFTRLGIYQIVLRQAGSDLTRKCLRGTLLSVAIVGAALFFYAPSYLPRSVVLIEACISAILTIGLREFVAHKLQKRSHRTHGSQAVLIYGAGMVGAQLAQSLRIGGQIKPIAFVDDDPLTWGLRVAGLAVFPPAQISSLVQKYHLKVALLAAPSGSVLQRAEMVQRLEDANLRIKEVPSLLDLLRGEFEVSELSEIDSTDLLGRGIVPPDPELFERVIPGRSVMVTGAGGSIGAEVCRQVAALGPARLVLYERSEYALYQIEMELAEHFPDVEIAAVLGSVLNRERMLATYQRFEVESVYHAAAYKHVPLVEQNPIEGVNNNVFGTLTAAETALEAGVTTFVLISTDKAVRPSNVMGASKRMAELGCLMLSDRAKTQAGLSGQTQTRFIMVRFGNVLDSAGSVVPLFRRQIAHGGPVTVTHREVTRYFMTIPEAAQLVIQASALGVGGEVFLLDMGEPIQVYELARRMINLATRGTSQTIEIEISGLRQGEKLVEELLVDAAHSKATVHPKIFKAVENGPPAAVIGAISARLLSAIDRDDLDAVYGILAEMVEGYVVPRAHVDVLQRKSSAFSFAVDPAVPNTVAADPARSFDR
jgi:UDP-N-acetylglucosamine 4,6-dehydratase